MPLGPELYLTGRLAEGPFGFELHSGGGVWELDTGRGARRLLGREVEVCGRRAGFNELICDQIWPVEDTPALLAPNSILNFSWRAVSWAMV